MNLNKLFPRLTIRAKLAIAFALIAGLPVVLVAGFATRVKVEHLRATTTSSLHHDLEMARSQVELALGEAEENVAYLARTLLPPVLAQPTPERLADAARELSAFVSYKQSLYQVKLIDADGGLLLVTGAPGWADAEERNQPSGMYYAYRAQSLEPGGQLLLPVELSAPASGRVAAVAILTAMWDESGRFADAVAGEAFASSLFAGLESGSVHLPGVTGLVDQDGFFLYHSERKRDWARLLASRSEVDLQREFSPDLAARVMEGGGGTVTAGDQIVSFTPLSLGGYASGPLFLYRAVALSTLEAPVRRVMSQVGLAGLLIGGLVLALAVVAAAQLTRPIYRLRRAMRELAGGGAPEPLQIATNDELEDLAGEFGIMANSLVTYRQRLEELVAERTRALHETYGELANVLAHSADAIVGLDTDGRVRVWNRGAETLFGYTSAGAEGRKVDTLLGGSRHEAAFLERKVLEEGAVVNFRTERVTRDGQRLPVSLTQSVIRDGDGVILGYSLILRDASMQARLEEQMRRSERLAAVSVMATALAHEVNNPLAIIANRIECMEREVHALCPNCKVEGDLTVLREHTERVVDVTRDLLGLAADRSERAGPVDLAAALERICRMVEQTFTARDIRFVRLGRHEDIPLFHGTEKALETVFLNLLLNAADATPAGGTVVLETRIARGGAEIQVEVRDTGSGIPADLRERIFEPFFTTKGPRGGTGLGLAVCRTVVERHGGRIQLESEPGRGSRFIVALPVNILVPT